MVIAGAATAVASCPIKTSLAQETITVGAAATTSDAPIYIADHLGYFREEGLTVKVTNFRSAADMVPVLGTGQLDAVPAPHPPASTTRSCKASTSRSSPTRRRPRLAMARPRFLSAPTISRQAVTTR
jgi:ABC-type nitrate/sulfonate/bicarbonate transport system substrate-binding protein